MDRFKKIQIPSVLMVINAILCLVYTEHVYSMLPTIFALIFIIRGAALFIAGLRGQAREGTPQSEISRAIVSIIMGVGIWVRQEDAIMVVGIFWGLYGMRKASAEMLEIAENIHTKNFYYLTLILEIIETVVGLALSYTLIFDPVSNVEHHVFILGIELLYEGALEVLHQILDKHEKTKRPPHSVKL